jgi:hypothetical protein
MTDGCGVFVVGDQNLPPFDLVDQSHMDLLENEPCPAL